MMIVLACLPIFKRLVLCRILMRSIVCRSPPIQELLTEEKPVYLPEVRLPACRRLLFPLLHAEKGRLRNAVANRVPVSRWQGILFRINCEIISG